MAEPEVTFATLDFDRGERFQTLRQELDVSSFGINLLLMQPRQRGRVHRHERQEEVYVVLEGQLTLLVEGAEHVLGARDAARVPAQLRRQLVNAGPERLVLLALGGAGEHAGRDGLAWESWQEGGPGRPPQEVPPPTDLPES
jgi:mannose-6-phosphate isomerase-like protein (cupin superfamily)